MAFYNCTAVDGKVLAADGNALAAAAAAAAIAAWSCVVAVISTAAVDVVPIPTQLARAGGDNVVG